MGSRIICLGYTPRIKPSYQVSTSITDISITIHHIASERPIQGNHSNKNFFCRNNKNKIIIKKVAPVFFLALMTSGGRRLTTHGGTLRMRAERTETPRTEKSSLLISRQTRLAPCTDGRCPLHAEGARCRRRQVKRPFPALREHVDFCLFRVTTWILVECKQTFSVCVCAVSLWFLEGGSF